MPLATEPLPLPFSLSLSVPARYADPALHQVRAPRSRPASAKRPPGCSAPGLTSARGHDGQRLGRHVGAAPALGLALVDAAIDSRPSPGSGAPPAPPTPVDAAAPAVRRNGAEGDILPSLGSVSSSRADGSGRICPVLFVACLHLSPAFHHFTLQATGFDDHAHASAPDEHQARPRACTWLPIQPRADAGAGANEQ